MPLVKANILLSQPYKKSGFLQQYRMKICILKLIY